MAYRRGSSVFLCTAMVLVTGVAVSQVAIGQTSGIFNVCDYGARGDGETLDTPAIAKAIAACASAGGGRVQFPPGRYLSGTVHLKSRVTLFFETGATLVGTTDLEQYQHPTLPAFLPEAKWGKWHRALILADGQEDIGIAGPGTIDGNKVFDPTGEERMRGPHTFLFVNCRRVTVRDVTFVDSANYAIFFQISDDVDIRDVVFKGGWDGVHFRGAPERSCRNVTIVGCQFFTGDDSIAGRYWEHTLISDCIVNSSCNGIRLIGPANHLTIHDCLFYGPGIEPHRTSNRHNMLAGINLQPGAWDATEGRLDDVLISDITMHNVCTPFHLSLKPGNTAGRVVVDRVTATGVYRAASSVESWAEGPFEDVVFRDVTIEYVGGGTAQQAATIVKSPGVDARPLPAWGFYAREVQRLELDNVRLRCRKDDQRPVLICQGVGRVVLEDLTFPALADGPAPLVLEEVGDVRVGRTEIPMAKPRCTGVVAGADEAGGRIQAGKPYAVIVTLENGDQEGLAKVEVEVGRESMTRWLWLQPGQQQKVVFKRPVAPEAGTYDLQCGHATGRLDVQP